MKIDQATINKYTSIYLFERDKAVPGGYDVKAGIQAVLEAFVADRAQPSDTNVEELIARLMVRATAEQVADAVLRVLGVSYTSVDDIIPQSIRAVVAIRTECETLRAEMKQRITDGCRNLYEALSAENRRYFKLMETHKEIEQNVEALREAVRNITSGDDADRYWIQRARAVVRAAEGLLAITPTAFQPDLSALQEAVVEVNSLRMCSIATIDDVARLEAAYERLHDAARAFVDPPTIEKKNEK